MLCIGGNYFIYEGLKLLEVLMNFIYFEYSLNFELKVIDLEVILLINSF